MQVEGNTTLMGYRRLWRDWLAPHKKLLILSFVLMVVTALASAGYSKAIQMIITAYETADSTVMYWGPLGIILISMTKGFSTYAVSLASNIALGRFEANLQKAMYSKLLYADLARLQLDSPASLAVRFSADVGLIRGSVRSIMNGVSAVLIILATIAVMLSIDWPITIVLIFLFAGAIGPVTAIGGKVRKITKKSQAQLSAMNSEIVEGLSSIRMVRTYQLEDHLNKSAVGIFDRLLHLKIKLLKWNARLSPLMEILSGFAIAALLFIVSWRISRGTITVADFMGLLTGVGIVSQPAKRLGSTFAGAMQGLVAMDRIYSILDAENAIADKADAKVIEKTEGGIAFLDVGFAYPNGFEALQGVNIDIPAGARVAFVGRSGAGKSTIFNLLPRLFDITSGEISLDGVDIRDITLESMRRQIAVVSQDSVLLAGTVADNIGFGNPLATRDEIRAAAKAAAADDFIMALEDGYDTVLSPSGGHFSGGEKQRLSIARAILRDAPILMLDEPTSALDAESEAAIRGALDKLSKGRTTLIIAHRLATILDADKIVVMDGGKVVETGTHAELLKVNGKYADLYRLQFAGA